MNERPTRMNLKATLIIMVALIGITFVLFRMLARHPGKGKTNPFEYNIEKFKHADTSRSDYEEEIKISVDLERLRAVAVGPENKIYVSGDQMVKVLNRRGDTLQTIHLSRPANCLAVDNQGDIYMGFNRHIEIYLPNGHVKKIWKSLDEKALITSLVVNQRLVFIADAGNFWVWKFSSEGSFLGKIGGGGKGEGDDGFLVPSPFFDVAQDPDGFLWVANPGRHRLENYYENGGFRSAWGKYSWNLDGFCGCCNPVHFTILSNGFFVTSEKGLNRVKVYNRLGELVCQVAGPDQFIEGTTGLDLARDSLDRIYLLDPPNHQVRIFKKKNSLRGGNNESG